MDQVHRLRDRYKADLVSLFVSKGDAGGLGYVMQKLTPQFEKLGFNVVVSKYATDYFVLAHELGHNMGCVHDRDNSDIPGVWDYSYGYQNRGAKFRTIMAYQCPDGCGARPAFFQSGSHVSKIGPRARAQKITRPR